MNSLGLAIRNLLRNRRRSVTTLLAMGIGLVSVLLFGGYIKDINYGLQTSYVQRTGHLQIQHKDYFLYGSGDPSSYGIEHYEQIIEVLKKDPVLAPMLRVATPTLQLGGIAGNFAAGVSRTIFATGMVVADQNEMRHWNDYHFPLRGGDLALTGSPPDSAVIGTGVARVLQLCGPLSVPRCEHAEKKADPEAQDMPNDVAALVGDSAEHSDLRPAATRIEILAASAHGAPNVAGVNVVKATYQGVKELDDVYVALHLAQAQRLVYGQGKPQVTAIALQLQHSDQIPAARERLDELLASRFKDEPLEVHDYMTLNPFYGQTLAMFAAIFGFIALLIGAIVLFTVSNTMSMAVVERTSEIGTLRAMGLRRAGIRRLFLWEGVVLGIVGAALGALAALAISAVLNRVGLTWTPPGQVEPVPLTIRVWGENGLVMATSLGLIIVAALSALWPAGRAARLNIVDALRHV
ncbi:MAG: FtsX-like permease family protein [Burkholderiaceae bacterium]|jgi:putative ABC transport system permease protein